MTPIRREPEQLIGVLVPAPLLDRPIPRSAPMPALPEPRPPADLSGVEILFGVACPDCSGRVTERGLLRALHGDPGRRIDIHPQHGMLIIGSAPAGRHAVGSRGELPLPATARRMCAIAAGQPLLFAALVAYDLLVIHPARTVARLLADLHAQAIEVRHVG
jgi:hypothetical protein